MSQVGPIWTPTFNIQGTCRELAIVVGNSDSFSSGSEFELGEEEPIQVKGSPLKVLSADKYR